MPEATSPGRLRPLRGSRSALGQPDAFGAGGSPHRSGWLDRATRERQKPSHATLAHATLARRCGEKGVAGCPDPAAMPNGCFHNGVLQCIPWLSKCNVFSDFLYLYLLEYVTLEVSRAAEETHFGWCHWNAMCKPQFNKVQRTYEVSYLKEAILRWFDSLFKLDRLAERFQKRILE